ncbi:hypothetical protein [Shouchella clausii]|uniref:hypothetical protein n=1 Tax=Shouchella clausii TaxID=79880 RepID=UPI000BA58776|nr:hypothetical protein [Shouchella clausii]PAD91656.1 hypothetical protein CHH52_13620 [Shouchella clausii]
MTYKVIDAKDGIVEKFEYEGATFKAVEGREPKEGDYLVITDEESARSLEDVTVGNPYLIEGMGVLYYKFTDDVGDHRFPSKNSLNLAIYEKVKPPKTTITHEGQTYKLVGRKAQPGDAVYVTEEAEGTDAVPNDRVYIVDRDGDIGVESNWTYPVYKADYNRTETTVKVYEPVAPQKRLIYRDSEGVTHTVLDAELVAYSSVEEDE